MQSQFHRRMASLHHALLGDSAMGLDEGRWVGVGAVSCLQVGITILQILWPLRGGSCLRCAHEVEGV